jgi:hypothetical protein
MRSGILLVLLLGGCRAEPVLEEAGDGGSVTLWTDSVELFMEYPALVVGEDAPFAVHLTDLTDFAAIATGRATFRLTPRGAGAAVTVEVDAPSSPGIYRPVIQPPAEGTWDLHILLAGAQARDSLFVPDLVVWPSREAMPVAAEEADDGSIGFLKEQQWNTPGFHTAFAVEGEGRVAVPAIGEVVPAGGREARVTAPLAGVLDVEGVARAPAPGTRVRQGDVLAILTPVLGDAGSALSEARRALRDAENDHGRAQRLLTVEAVPARRVEEAASRLMAAREAVGALGGDGVDAEGRIVVRAPIAGVVVARSVPPGSRVEAGALLFAIVDPSVAWVRVQVPAAEAAAVRRTPAALILPEGAEQWRRTSRVVAVGSVLDADTRTLPVLYELDNAEGGVLVGSVVQVLVQGGEMIRGVRIPRSAALEEDGQLVAFVQTSGEGFARRVLDVAGADVETLILRSGVLAGERVVTGAASYVRLASLSTTVPAHGHAH